MYELNVRQFSKEGTFNAIIPHLPRLKKMGIDVVWLMPIQPIGVKNRKGSSKEGPFFMSWIFKDGLKEKYKSIQTFRAIFCT